MGHSRPGTRFSGDGRRSSSQRAQPTRRASTPRGVWVISTRYSALRFRLAWEWVRSRVPPGHAEERKDERGARGAQPPCPHRPLEDGEHHHQAHGNPMLENRRIGHSFPEALGTEGPGAGVVAHNEEDGQTQKDERPVARPAAPDRAGDDGEQTHGEDEEPRGVVVVLRPRAIGVGARGIGIVRGQLPVGGRHQPRKLRREDLSDLGQGRPIGDDVDGRGDGRQRRRPRGARRHQRRIRPPRSAAAGQPAPGRAG